MLQSYCSSMRMQVIALYLQVAEEGGTGVDVRVHGGEMQKV